MGRRMLLGVALLAGIVTPSAWPEAAPRKAADATFVAGWVNDEPTLLVEGRGVKFFKRVGRDKVSIRVEVPGDVVQLEADLSGAVKLGRQGRVLQLHMKGNIAAGVEKAQKFTAGSRALAAFEGMVASLSTNQSQHAQSVRSSYALLHAVRGVTVPMLAPPPAAAAAGPVSRAIALGKEGPFACWMEYATTIYEYNVQFNSCIEDYWWIPGWNAACAFQFALQAELAWFWLLGCSGGLPV